MTVAFDSDVDLTIEAAFGYAPLATPTWTDISAYVRTATIRRGRSHELDTIGSSTARLTLSNADGRFDPTHTSGAYYPNVRPMVPIRIQAVHNSITYDLVRGFAEAWPQAWPQYVDSVVTLRVVDAFKLLGRIYTDTAEVQESSDTRMGNLLDDAGWPAGWRDLATGDVTVAAYTPNGESVLRLCRTVDKTEGGLFFVSGDGDVTLQEQTHRAGLAVAAVFGDAGAELRYSRLKLGYDDHQIWNGVDVQREGGATQSVEDATSIGLYGKRTLKIHDTLHTSDAEALTYAGVIRDRYKDPHVRVDSIGFKPRSSVARTILNRAELLLRASDYSGSGNLVDSLVGKYEATLNGGVLWQAPDGFTKGDVTSGEQFVFLPGTSGNVPAVPDHDDFDIVGDPDVRADIAPNDWTPPANIAVVTHWSSNAGYILGLSGSGSQGLLRLSWDATGANSTVAPTVADGDRLAIRANRDATTGVVQFFTAPTRSGPWTQLGADVASTPSAITANASSVYLGALNSVATQGWEGKFYSAQIYDGIDGTKVLDVDFTRRDLLTEPYATFLSADGGHTVTINRSSLGVPSTVVDRPMFILDGVDDYLEVADHADLDFGSSESLTVVAVGRIQNGAGGSDVIVSKHNNPGSASTAGWQLYQATGEKVLFFIADGSVSPRATPASTTTDQVLHVWSGVRDVAADDITSFQDGATGTPVTDSTTATLANSLPLRIGANSATAARFMDGQIMAVALFREALTDAEILSLTAELIESSTTDLWEQALGAELSDKYTVKRRVPAGNTISQDVYVEGITHNLVAKTKSWETTFNLSQYD